MINNYDYGAEHAHDHDGGASGGDDRDHKGDGDLIDNVDVVVVMEVAKIASMQILSSSKNSVNDFFR